MALDFQRDLNPAQAQAALHDGGPLLVIAGAGSGKTRTIVYRLARLVQQGVDPAHILLLTFTRKAAQEMLHRAGDLLGHHLPPGGGGTFHSFAYRVLRRHAGLLGLPEGFTVMDRADAADILGEVKDQLKIGKGDRSFPKRAAILELISKARNKELGLVPALEAESFHLLAYAAELEKLAAGYAQAKRTYRVLDYDDLLFELEALLRDQPQVRQQLSTWYSHLMVDEYQDTNKVQARLVRLLAAEEGGTVMAVGDDAQSIYAFRGADVANILRFPEDFPGTTLVRLEQNYRSTQPILDLTNAILAGARQKFDKHLFTQREHGDKPDLVKTLSDTTQARLVFQKIEELARSYPLHEIAVLFRAGYQSFQLEVLLNKARVPFRKYGGIRFTEAAHVKDVLAYLRLVVNAADLPAWQRALAYVGGVGPKTATRIVAAMVAGNQAELAKFRKKFAELGQLIDTLEALRREALPPAQALERLVAFYTPILIREHPEDYPRRQQGLEQMAVLAGTYQDVEQFLADVVLESPEEDAGPAEGALVLSTIHSAKGLEWKAVVVIDLVEERFPARRSLLNPEDMEEERRLLYVACTRARDYLALYAPQSLYNRQHMASEPARPSPFVLEWSGQLCDEWRENLLGGLLPARPQPGTLAAPAPTAPVAAATSSVVGQPTPSRPKLGFCNHKIYGQGKVIEHIPPDKFRVNFRNFGVKVIIGSYLQFEE